MIKGLLILSHHALCLFSHSTWSKHGGKTWSRSVKKRRIAMQFSKRHQPPGQKKLSFTESSQSWYRQPWIVKPGYKAELKGEKVYLCTFLIYIYLVFDDERFFPISDFPFFLIRYPFYLERATLLFENLYSETCEVYNLWYL